MQYDLHDFEGDGGGRGFLQDDYSNLLRSGARERNGDTITPLPISYILEHLERAPEQDLVVGDTVVETIKLVAQVMDMERSDDVWTFELDDSTGTICCAWAVANTVGVDHSPWWREYMNLIAEGSYVTVHGVINVFQTDAPPFNVMYLFPVEVNEEPFLHLVLCAEHWVRKHFNKPAHTTDDREQGVPMPDASALRDPEIRYQRDEEYPRGERVPASGSAARYRYNGYTSPSAMHASSSRKAGQLPFRENEDYASHDPRQQQLQGRPHSGSGVQSGRHPGGGGFKSFFGGF